MKKQALLVGINNYSKMGSLNNLRFARQDAEAVSAALQSNYGFTEDEITLMTCEREGTLSPATPDNILNQMQSDQFSEPLDLFIFGFWGHGIWESNVRYLCPMSTLQNKLSNTCLPLNDIFQCVSELPIHNACFILDCCQNIAGRGAMYMSEEEKDYLENLGRNIIFNNKKKVEQNAPAVQRNDFERRVAILNSCRPGEIAYEWDEKKHGIFTAHLLEAMRKRLRTVTDWATHLSNYVSKTAARLGKSAQTPLYSLEGCIELPAVSDPIPTPLPSFNEEPEFEKETLIHAALKLVELFQESVRIHEKESVKEWFLHQKEQFMSVYAALESGSITAQMAYSRLLELARNAGNWIKANRNLLGGGRHVFVSYEWYSWKKFAEDKHLENISEALHS